MSKDYYNILGVERNSTPDEIKKSYRKLAMEHHPDRGGDSDVFKDISEAYEVLSDSDKKYNYDNYGDPNGMGNHQYSRSHSPFDDLFSGFANSQHNRRGFNKGSDLRIIVETDLLTNLNGCKKTIKINRNKVCKPCYGKGGTGVKTCHTCNGSGYIIKEVNTIMGFMRQRHMCPSCDGVGHTIKDKCSNCGGEKVVNETDTIEIELPKGVMDGDTLRMRGKGNEIPEGMNGDLYIKVKMDYMGYEVEGINIKKKISINIIDAINGTYKDIETLSNKVRIDIKKGTQPNSILRIRGKGLTDSRKMGDMLIEVEVRIPTDLTEDESNKINEISNLDCFKK